MKTKHYEFTQIELLALKEACIEYYQTTKHLKPNSSIAIRMFKALETLKDQFKNDYNLFKITL